MLLKPCYRPCLVFLAAAFLLGAGRPAAPQDPESTWDDGQTGLTWAVRDNGEDVSWNQAREYCANLQLGGATDWRLPTVDELKTLFDRSQSKPYKAKGPIELGMPGIWSSSTNNSGDVWSFNFSYGGKSLSPTSGCNSAGRALCVRPTD